MRRFIMAFLWCMSPWATAASAQLPSQGVPTQDWTSSRRHFSFSGIVFDIDNGAWAQGSRLEPLADCSDARTHCLSSATFSLVLPRRCADLAANRWAAGNVTTELFLRHVAPTPPPHGGSPTTLYLGSASRPGQLFVYDPLLGITGLYWDDTNRTNFALLARERRLEGWLFGEANRTARQRIYFHRTTFDPVGSCS
jgi:hypothetical protein